jgi:protein phosphatase
MGGAAAGEVASGLAVDTIQARYEDERRRCEPAEAIRSAIVKANDAIYDRSAADQKLGGMGTTCTTVSFVGRDVVWGHVGDSRAYLVQADSIGQLTNDHTLASELSQLSKTVGAPAQAANNVLTRSLGNEESVEVDVDSLGMLLDGDSAIVLCSDGLSNMVADNEIQEIVSEFAPIDACRELVELARARGGPDNITVIVAKLKAD